MKNFLNFTLAITTSIVLIDAVLCAAILIGG